jgi:hypothetical protein
MAKRRGDHGRSDYQATVSSNVIKTINEMNTTGNTAAVAGTTDGTAKAKIAAPDYSGIDFTGMKGNEVKRAKQAIWSPEYAAQAKEASKRKKAMNAPFTDEFIASSGALSAIKNGLTYEQALANLRKSTKVTNLLPLEGKKGPVSAKKYKKMYAALTPAQKDAQWAFGILGGFGSDYGGSTGSETYRQRIFRQLGMDPSTLKNYAPVKETTRTSSSLGPVTSYANPLNAKQRAKLQALRALGSVTKKQSAALARLRAKKNAPTILP